MTGDRTPDLDDYLERIGFEGTPRADAQTLIAVHRAHLRAIPYENLDVQLSRPVGLELEPIYRKLVLERRGGWCYEMNGLLAWALESIGFELTRLAAGVGRAALGDAALGNHLALWVHLEDGWLADVGFGDGTLEPVRLRPGAFSQGGFEFSLEASPDGWWRLHNHPAGAAPSFDFTLAPADRRLLERQCRYLQTSDDSPFTRAAVVQRHVPEGLAVLRGRMLRVLGAPGSVGGESARREARREIRDRNEYESVLQEIFDLEVPDLDTLWTRVEGQHAAYLARLGLRTD